MINDDDEWLVHLIINGKQQPDDERAANTQTLIDSIESPGRFHLEQLPIARRCWLDRGPEIAHGAALRWPVFDALGTPGLPYNEAPLVGVSSVDMHRLQPRLRTEPHSEPGAELVYFVTAGSGTIAVGGSEAAVEEGDFVYAPPGVEAVVTNDSDGWLEWLTVTA